MYSMDNRGEDIGLARFGLLKMGHVIPSSRDRVVWQQLFCGVEVDNGSDSNHHHHRNS